MHSRNWRFSKTHGDCAAGMGCPGAAAAWAGASWLALPPPNMPPPPDIALPSIEPAIDPAGRGHSWDDTNCRYGMKGTNVADTTAANKLGRDIPAIEVPIMPIMPIPAAGAAAAAGGGAPA
eukprot:6631600-Prymnesium_polylepis.1